MMRWRHSHRDDLLSGSWILISSSSSAPTCTALVYHLGFSSTTGPGCRLPLPYHTTPYWIAGEPGHSAQLQLELELVTNTQQWCLAAAEQEQMMLDWWPCMHGMAVRQYHTMYSTSRACCSGRIFWPGSERHYSVCLFGRNSVFQPVSAKIRQAERGL